MPLRRSLPVAIGALTYLSASARSRQKSPRESSLDPTIGRGTQMNSGPRYFVEGRDHLELGPRLTLIFPH